MVFRLGQFSPMPVRRLEEAINELAERIDEAGGMDEGDVREVITAWWESEAAQELQSMFADVETLIDGKADAGEVYTKAEVDGLLSGLEDEVSTVQSRVSTLADDIEAVEARISAVESDVSGLTDELAGVEARVASLEAGTE